MRQFVQLLQDHRWPMAPPGHHHVQEEKWIGLDCHRCSPRSHKYRLGFNKAFPRLSCWICGKISLYEFLTVALNLNGRQASTIISDLRRGRRPLPGTETVNDKRLQLPLGAGSFNSFHRQYLNARKLEPQKMTELWQWQGLDGLCGAWSWRILIPIHLGDQVVSFTTRTIKPRGLRYISAKPHEELFSHKNILYGEEHARHCIVVSEGPFGAATLGPGGVCTFGVDYSQRQFIRMTNFPVRAVCFDAQPEAQRRARKLVNDLATIPGETYNIVLDSGKDLNEADSAEVEEIRNRFFY